MVRNIRELCYVWSKMTYGECLEHILQTETDEELKKLSRQLFMQLGWYNQLMVGYSVEQLEKKDKVEKKHYISFSDIYRGIKTQDYFLPTRYALDVIRKIKEKNIPSECHIALIGRAMRTFASFLREEDLEFNLLKKSIFWETVSNAELDKKEHTDIIYKLASDEFYIWSYQCSKRGLINLREKLLGRRKGIIRKGTHILVPVIDDNKNEYNADKKCGWNFTPEKEVEDVIFYCDSTVSDFSNDDIIINLGRNNYHIYKYASLILRLSHGTDDEWEKKSFYHQDWNIFKDILIFKKSH